MRPPLRRDNRANAPLGVVIALGVVGIAAVVLVASFLGTSPFSMAAPCRVEGTVRGDGQLLSGATLQIRTAELVDGNLVWSTLAEVRTGQDGQYSIGSSCSPGPRTLRAFADGWFPSDSQLSWNDGQDHVDVRNFDLQPNLG